MKKKFLTLFLALAAVAIGTQPSAAGVGCDTWGYHFCANVCARMNLRCEGAERPGSSELSEHCQDEYYTCLAHCELQGGCMPFVVAPEPSK